MWLTQIDSLLGVCQTVPGPSAPAKRTTPTPRNLERVVAAQAVRRKATEQRILGVISHNPITAKQIAEALDMEPRYIIRRLHRMTGVKSEQRCIKGKHTSFWSLE